MVGEKNKILFIVVTIVSKPELLCNQAWRWKRPRPDERKLSRHMPDRTCCITRAASPITHAKKALDNTLLR